MSTHTNHEGDSFPASPARPDVPKSQGEHPSDLTITYAQRLVLERVSQGLQLGDLATDDVVGPLLDADLLTERVRDGRLVGWGLTELGEAVLHARYAQLPDGWSRDTTPGLQGWYFHRNGTAYSDQSGVSRAWRIEHARKEMARFAVQVELMEHLERLEDAKP